MSDVLQMFNLSAAGAPPSTASVASKRLSPRLDVQDASVCAEIIALEMRCRDLELERNHLEQENDWHTREVNIGHEEVNDLKLKLEAAEKERRKVADDLVLVRESLAAANEVIAKHRASLAVKSFRELQYAEELAKERARARQQAHLDDLREKAQQQLQQRPAPEAREEEVATSNTAETTSPAPEQPGRANGSDSAEPTKPQSPQKVEQPTREKQILQNSERRQWYTTPFGLFALIGLVVGLGMLSGTIGGEPGPWYESLHKPAGTPLRWAFPVVWTSLYTMMAAALWLVLRAEPSKQQQTAITLFWAQFFVNFCFSIVFFRNHSLFGALLDCLVLDVLVLLTKRQFCKVDKRAGCLLIPYVLWLCAATSRRVYDLAPERLNRMRYP